MATYMEEKTIPGLVKVQTERIVKKIVEIDVLLMKNPFPRGAVYGVAREIVGHASEMMKLCKAAVKAEILAKLNEESESAST